MPNPVPALTEDDFAALTSGRNVAVTLNAATLRVARIALAPGWPEETRFIMEGPSGRHTLLRVATDLDRLNAHWTTFAAHPLNATAAVAA